MKRSHNTSSSEYSSQEEEEEFLTKRNNFNSLQTHLIKKKKVEEIVILSDDEELQEEIEDIEQDIISSTEDIEQDIISSTEDIEQDIISSTEDIDSSEIEIESSEEENFPNKESLLIEISSTDPQNLSFYKKIIKTNNQIVSFEFNKFIKRIRELEEENKELRESSNSIRGSSKDTSDLEEELFYLKKENKILLEKLINFGKIQQEKKLLLMKLDQLELTTKFAPSNKIDFDIKQSISRDLLNKITLLNQEIYNLRNKKTELEFTLDLKKKENLYLNEYLTSIEDEQRVVNENTQSSNFNSVLEVLKKLKELESIKVNHSDTTDNKDTSDLVYDIANVVMNSLNRNSDTSNLEIKFDEILFSLFGYTIDYISTNTTPSNNNNTSISSGSITNYNCLKLTNKHYSNIVFYVDYNEKLKNYSIRKPCFKLDDLDKGLDGEIKEKLDKIMEEYEKYVTNGFNFGRFFGGVCGVLCGD